jgi:two-component system CheB/CheR fusion protein
MPPSRRRKITKIIRYLVVVLLTTAALLLAAFMPDQQIQPLFFLYLGAAMVAGWYGGWKSGMLITCLAGLGLFYLLIPATPRSAFQSTEEFIRFTIFAATALLACWGLAGLHFSQVALRSTNQKLDRAVGTLETLIETMPMGVVAVEAETGRVTLANSEAASLAGVSANLHFDSGADVLASAPESPARVAMFRSLDTGEAVDNVEFAVKTKAGAEKVVLLGTAPIRATNGDVVGAVATFRDITALKRAERSLMVNEKLAATGRLAAAIAHEINNPISAVINLLFLLQAKTLDPTSRGMVEVAQQEMMRMGHIVKQMLAFYRESSSPVALRVSQMMNDLLSLYAGNIQERNITVETDYKFGGEIEAYSGELRQVLSNLITNAVEAIPNGGRIRVRVSASNLWDRFGTPAVRITIADTGTGIKPEHRDSIFEPFFTTKADKGTGLGLWVTHGIVRKQGGSIRVHSRTQPGNSGSCFAVFLPIRAVQKKLVSPVQRASSAQSAI